MTECERDHKDRGSKKSAARIVTGGKVALKEIFYAQHSLGIAVTVVT
ncbi:hypothetical protein EATG_00151 [Escherichia coli H605]|uniref:Uncharacterized protein n=1 Tax=Escherichia coli H605 TaxID=656410 RepID=A0AAJ3P0I0_ECOLX|nr:hypothetical protein EATG_00151 [Escherichia coli H605]